MLNPMNLEGKTILVTGASAGIGRETALLLAELGAQLVLVARNQEKLQETHSLLPKAGHVVAPFDLSKTEIISQWLKECANNNGPLHSLVHCAGIHLAKPLRMMAAHDYQTVMNTNMGSAFNLAKAFCQKGVAHRPSSIVLVSSVMGLHGQSGISAYAASKGALIAFSKSLAMEVAHDGIRVNCVAPGIVETPMSEQLFSKMTVEQINEIRAMHPLGFGKPRDVANAIAFLIADTGRWITGTTLVTDGGYCAH